MRRARAKADLKSSFDSAYDNGKGKPKGKKGANGVPVAPENDEPSALSEWKEESEKQSRLNHVRV